MSLSRENRAHIRYVYKTVRLSYEYVAQPAGIHKFSARTCRVYAPRWIIIKLVCLPRRRGRVSLFREIHVYMHIYYITNTTTCSKIDANGGCVAGGRLLGGGQRGEGCTRQRLAPMDTGETNSAHIEGGPGRTES